MCSRVLRFTALWGVILAFASLAHAQSSPTPLRISLDQAIQLATTHNHALLAARNAVAQSKDEEITANLRPNPVFTTDVIGLPQEPDDFSADNINQAEFDIGAAYLFERGKKRQHRLRAAKDATAVTTAAVADNERTLTFNVATAFINVLLAESTLDFAKQDLASFQDTINISQEQYKAGAISEGNFLKIKLQLLQFQTDVTAAQLARQQSLIALRQLLGFESVPENYEVSGTLAYEGVPYGLEDLQAMAIKERPDLRAAQLAVTAARSQYLLAKANGKVDITGTLNETHITGFNSSSIILSMPLPIFDRNQGEIARTNTAVAQAQQLQEAASEQVMSDVQSAFESVHTDADTLKIYQSGYLDQAKQSVDISQYAYKRGAASLLDFLDAERSYRTIQLAYRQQLASYMLALEQLREAVGTRNLP